VRPLLSNSYDSSNGIADRLWTTLYTSFKSARICHSSSVHNSINPIFQHTTSLLILESEHVPVILCLWCSEDFKLVYSNCYRLTGWAELAIVQVSYVLSVQASLATGWTTSMPTWRQKYSSVALSRYSIEDWPSPTHHDRLVDLPCTHCQPLTIAIN